MSSFFLLTVGVLVDCMLCEFIELNIVSFWLRLVGELGVGGGLVLIDSC